MLVIPLFSSVASIFFLGVTEIVVRIFPAYIIGLVIFFFLPLSSVHKVMAQAKEDELRTLSNEFNKAYDLVLREIKKPDLSINEETQGRIEIMNTIKDLYEEASKMPVWPYNPATIQKFASTIGIPLLAFVAKMYGIDIGIDVPFPFSW